MSDAELVAIGLAAADKSFARQAYEASGQTCFKELADGKPGAACQKVRKWLASRQGWNRVSDLWTIREAVLRAIKERRNSEARNNAVAALLAGDTAQAAEIINAMAERPTPELKVV